MLYLVHFYSSCYGGVTSPTYFFATSKFGQFHPCGTCVSGCVQVAGARRWG